MVEVVLESARREVFLEEGHVKKVDSAIGAKES
jgi:hypothetical protein